MKSEQEENIKKRKQQKGKNRKCKPNMGEGNAISRYYLCSTHAVMLPDYVTDWNFGRRQTPLVETL
jgi:hypothetical protein